MKRRFTKYPSGYVRASREDLPLDYKNILKTAKRVAKREGYPQVIYKTRSVSDYGDYALDRYQSTWYKYSSWDVDEVVAIVTPDGKVITDFTLDDIQNGNINKKLYPNSWYYFQ